MSETVEFLAPQRILEDTLESRDLDRPAISDHRIYKIVISHRDADGSQFRETFTVDRYMEMERTILDADLRNKAIDQLSKRISKLTERLQGSP